jgi:hypothetical protein
MSILLGRTVRNARSARCKEPARSHVLLWDTYPLVKNQANEHATKLLRELGTTSVPLKRHGVHFALTSNSFERRKGVSNRTLWFGRGQ